MSKQIRRKISQLTPFLQPIVAHWRSMSLGLLLGLLTVIAGVGLLSLSGWLISVSAGAGLAMATALAFNYYLPGGAVRAFSLIRILGRYGERVVTHEATLRILTTLRVWFYQKIEPLAPAGLLTSRSGDLLSRIISDIDTLDEAYLRVVGPFLIAVLLSIILLFFLHFFSIEIAWCVFLLMVLSGFCVPLLALRLGHATGGSLVTELAQLRIHCIDSTQGLMELLSFGHERRAFAQLQTRQGRLLRLQARMNQIDALSQALILLFTGLALWLALYLGAQLVLAQQLNGVNLALIAFAVLAAFEVIMPLPLAFQYLGRTGKAISRLLNLAEQQPVVLFTQDGINTNKLLDSSGNYSIEFDQVNFAYPGRETIFNNFNLCIHQGEKVAIVGSTGAGKTTLIQLLTRVFDADSGMIKVGDNNLKDFSEPALRRLMGVVSQRSYLFNMSVRDNLLLAKPTASDKELNQVLKTVQLFDVVQRLPEGLDTWVGEHGSRFSGGQIRRIAVARALLADHPIILLDEPTEGLDPLTADEFMKNLITLMAGRTVLLITHRLTDVQGMDKIAVMENGQLIECGTEAQLLQANKRYASLYAQYYLV
ncbi:Putative multidrug export ATP-binding/permease protein [Piscirickettsia salmonis]|uniref:ABC transporter n=2 Tax=Piscirickettsia salmonis TaxID=1238 RepID=A0AAC8VGQ6_PISSA|nr:thiol reductant ABC exporter subunit CydC [Piscirickettsia salmonis]ALB22059.1 ABC transporter [Piscirickettsia salmonis]QGN99326.1 Putative multidrug export ATP-binding/permease protein [Piscirickettsia salmonis]QGO02959.1 Putative multidrug export ATP-binding/permease protein [Piscirickettsia salmonis]QGO13618.1 Putative multidrug export ATP-binding/permease protein [Piscirickettsia salmonis]QGO20694.1 Putative multidrug export ATP-binding/permease protein [Piscirickettsia salmonis]